MSAASDDFDLVAALRLMDLRESESHYAHEIKEARKTLRAYRPALARVQVDIAEMLAARAVRL